MKSKYTLKQSFAFAFEGFVAACRSSRNLKIHLCFVVAVTIAGLLFQINKIEWIICLLLFALVISLEMVNTALEYTMDLISTDYHPTIKKVKDIAAGAVLVSAVIAAIIGLIIFVPYLVRLVKIG